MGTVSSETEAIVRHSPSDDRVAILAKNSLERLLAWIETSNSITPDPYDIKRHPWIARRLATRNQIVPAIGLKAAYAMVALFPEEFPRLLGIKPKQTAGAASWIAQGYLELYRYSKSARHLETAELWLSRLRDMRLRSCEECSWGFYSDWQTSTVVIRENSPLLYSNWLGGHAYLTHYGLTSDEESLETALSACRALVRILNRAVDTRRHLCLAYSPHDTMQVFNTNALAGALLCDVGLRAGVPSLTDCGRRMLNWVADGQQPDGSWEYFSRDFSPGGSVVDHYHMAMTLQGLLDGSEHLQVDTWNVNLRRGLQFYLSRLFDRRGRPRFTSTKTFPIDIMSCAEGLILLGKVRNSPVCLPSGLRDDAVERLKRLMEWVCRKFQSPGGPFYYRAYPLRRLPLFSFRWGQGAMLKALARFLSD